jgi:hypothetical protein
LGVRENHDETDDLADGRRERQSAVAGRRARTGARRAAPGARPTLTPLDYIEIQQLVYRYGYAPDSGADNGYAYADLYAPDATFTGTNQDRPGAMYQPRAAGSAGRGGKRGPAFVSHYAPTS